MIERLKLADCLENKKMIWDYKNDVGDVCHVRDVDDVT